MKAMMRSWALLALVLAVTDASAQQLLGTGEADTNGLGVIQFNVEPTVDAQLAAEQISTNLQLTDGATLQSVTVENGVVTIEFTEATPGALVEASVPSDVASAIGFGVPGAAGAPLAQGSSPWAWAGGGFLVGAGGLAAGLEAADKLGEEDREFVLSPGQ
ncbi:MAG: hypothetical protein ACREQY_21955 [Candidatus Binatia bacterium]